MSIPLQVLIVEDLPADVELILYELQRAGYDPQWQWVETELDYLAALTPVLDMVLADYSLPEFDALRALQLLQERDLDIPFIIVSGTIGEDIAVAAIKQGATDYLLKDRLARLGLAVSHALEQRQLRAEKRQHQAYSQAQERLAIVGQLAAGIAHDFNNILTPILLYSDISLNIVSQESHVWSNLQHIREAANRAKALVSQILVFSRQGKGQEREPIYIQPIINEALELLRAVLPATIEIRKDSNPHAGTVLANPTQLHQVIMNLCTNAYHAMRIHGGMLTMSLDTVEVDTDLAALHANLKTGTYIRLTVSDTGPGMDQGTLKRIFEPFFTTKSAGEGTGMGLALVDEIVKNHDGAILADSQPGQGTTFRIYLPQCDNGATSQGSTDRPVPSGTGHILLVDDEQTIGFVAKKILEDLDYTVTMKTDSIETLELFRAQPDQFDLVITDIVMPKMTGVELAWELMQIRPDILIIFITGFGEFPSTMAATEVAVHAHLMKPFTVADLAETVRQVLDAQKRAEG